MRISRLFLLLTIPLLFTSCFKDDERVEPYDRGEKITAVIPMTEIVGQTVYLYVNQVYYNLNSSAVVATNDKKAYDLAFDAAPEKSRIWLNTANFMTAGRTTEIDLEAVSSSAGLDMRFDPSSGNADSTAIGDWYVVSGNDTLFTAFVYVLDRGYDEFGNLLGKRKIAFDSIKGDTYYFRYSNLNNTSMVNASVKKQAGYNKVYFSFEGDGSQVQPEPPQSSYDLEFTQYTTLLFTNEGEPYPYLVTGLLLNTYQTEVAFDNSMVFDEIDLVSAQNMQYSAQIDRIGYDWKEVQGDVENGVVNYVVRPENNYIIRNQTGQYFKMRFVGFYDDNGVKGFPTIEYQKL